MAKVNARHAAATGKERPKKVSDVEVEKKSINFPIVRGINIDTEEETNNCHQRFRFVSTWI
jgi:hypothetical protein